MVLTLEDMLGESEVLEDLDVKAPIVVLEHQDVPNPDALLPSELPPALEEDEILLEPLELDEILAALRPPDGHTNL